MPKTAAVITLYRPDKLTRRGRRSIYYWLLRQAKHLVNYGDNYAPRFTARYLYDGKTESL